MSNTNARRLTDQERAWLMWQCGHDTFDIARRLRRSEANIYSWLIMWRNA